MQLKLELPGQKSLVLEQKRVVMEQKRLVLHLLVQTQIRMRGTRVARVNLERTS